MQGERTQQDRRAVRVVAEAPGGDPDAESDRVDATGGRQFDAVADFVVYNDNEEAFSAQYLGCEKELKLDRAKCNVNGGAIALGHPLGATGTFGQF